MDERRQERADRLRRRASALTKRSDVLVSAARELRRDSCVLLERGQVCRERFENAKRTPAWRA